MRVKEIAIRWKLIGIIVLVGGLLLGVVSSNSKTTQDRITSLWQVTEWTLENPTWSGNPYDLIARATFVHAPSGERRSTPMFYAGDQRWKFRFTGTQTGNWHFSTQSEDANLDGWSGVVTVGPRANPALKGFLTSVGNKYAIMDGNADDLEGYVYQVYMNQQDYSQQHEHHSRILGHPDRQHLIPDYWQNTQENGFNTYFYAVFYSWFKMGALGINDFSSNSDSQLDTPDPALFDALEHAIQYAHERGGRTHIWAWGDNDRRQTPNYLGDGFRGQRHQRLIRYIAARLGPIPGWSMNFGFDTMEMPNSEADSAWWAGELNKQMGWPHILSSRGWNNANFGAGSYAGFGGLPYDLQTSDKGPANYLEIKRHMDALPSKPSIYEERHTFNRWQCWPDDVPDRNRLNEPGSRRLMWRESMAGGMGGFFGHYSERFNQFGPFKPEGPCGYYPESLKTAFRTHQEFWKNGRLRLDLQPDDRLISQEQGVCLSDDNKTHIICYVEDTQEVAIDLSSMSGQQPAIVVDAKTRFRELDRGRVKPGIHRWTFDHRTDWVVAIGNFGVE